MLSVLFRSLLVLLLFLKVIPEQDEIGSAKLGKCAVVGNSGSLLHSGHGKEIDAHDAVIRFNGAPTKNYEADVGSKTTVRIQNVDNLGFHEHDDKYLIFTARNVSQPVFLPSSLILLLQHCIHLERPL